MIIFIISLLPAVLLFGIGLALHCWASFKEQWEEQGEEAEAEEIKYNEIREQHREQAKLDMAEMNVFATYYGGLNNER